MRFLKNKIARARVTKTEPTTITNTSKIQDSPHTDRPAQEVSLTKKRNRVPGSFFTPEKSRATKNIVKNYGKAICKFINSPMAFPHLQNLVKKEGVKLPEFLNFVRGAKGVIDGLYHFRSILLPTTTDDEKTAAFRRIFRDIGQVFIKFFSVNWIYNSKLVHKRAHLDFRFKMLRRIKDPEHFTFLKSTKKST